MPELLSEKMDSDVYLTRIIHPEKYLIMVE